MYQTILKYLNFLNCLGISGNARDFPKCLGISKISANACDINNTFKTFIPSQEAFGLSVEDMSKMMTSELLDGCVDDLSVKAGFIGEIGCCYPMNG